MMVRFFCKQETASVISFCKKAPSKMVNWILSTSLKVQINEKKPKKLDHVALLSGIYKAGESLEF